MPEIIKKLQPAEIESLASLETVIKRGLKSFVEVGTALLSIRDGRLYREDYATFEAYCNDKWGFSRIHAHRMIDAAKVCEVLPIGNKPTNEAQARPLAALPPEKQGQAWKAATDTAKAAGTKVTAKAVEAEVNKLLPPKPAKPAAAPVKGKQVTTGTTVQDEKPSGMIGGGPPFPKSVDLMGACKMFIFGEPSIHHVRFEKMCIEGGIDIKALFAELQAVVEKHVKAASKKA